MPHGKISCHLFSCTCTGIDYILTKRNDLYAAIGIKVNSYNSIKHCDLSEFMDPDLTGLSVGPLVQTMCERSQKYVMSGKTVVVIGAGGISKQFIWPATKKENIRVSVYLLPKIKIK